MTIIPPKDSTHISPYPYSVSYAGRLRNVDDAYSYIPLRWFDTTYDALIMVNYPDSSHIKFHLAFWDICPASFHLYGQDSLYYYEQDNYYVINQLNAYLDSSHHHTLRYTLRNDSLIINKHDFPSSGTQQVTFFGKKQ